MLADDCVGGSTKVEECGGPCSSNTTEKTNTTDVSKDLIENSKQLKNTTEPEAGKNSEIELIPTEPGFSTQNSGKVNHKAPKTVFISIFLSLKGSEVRNYTYFFNRIHLLIWPVCMRSLINKDQIFAVSC